MSNLEAEADLAELLSISEALDEDVGKLLGKCQPHSTRGVIAMALCSTAHEHALSQRLLLDAGLTGTALALCRLQFEAVVRAAWTAQCATDEWLQKFTTPVEGPKHQEPASQVPIATMLMHIDQQAPHVAAEFSRLLTTIKAMHSFVHSGSQAVAHALMPSYPSENLMAVVWNRNLPQWYTANAAVIAAQDQGLVPRMPPAAGEAQRVHAADFIRLVEAGAVESRPEAQCGQQRLTATPHLKCRGRTSDITDLMKNMFVLDQNGMQRPALREFMTEHPHAKYIVPDIGLVEMTKSEKWEETFRRNFAVLVPVVGRCYMSLSVQGACDLELKTFQTCEGRLLPRDFTQLLRGAILGSQPGHENSTMQRIRDGIEIARRELADNDLNASAARDELAGRIEQARRRLSAEEIKACRRPETARIARQAITRNVGDALYVSHMERNKIAPQVARRLWKQRGMNRRWAYMLAHNAMAWLGDGGLDNAPDRGVLNDVLDQDYVLFGSFFNGVLSLEQSLHDALLDLKVLLEQPLGPYAPV